MHNSLSCHRGHRSPAKIDEQQPKQAEPVLLKIAATAVPLMVASDIPANRIPEKASAPDCLASTDQLRGQGTIRRPHLVHPRPALQERIRVYEFTAPKIGLLATATNELELMSLAAVQHIIDNKLYRQLNIPESAVPLIEASWESEPPSLYGRFDFAYTGEGHPKLLEYNADTPTSLLEASVVQ